MTEPAKKRIDIKLVDDKFVPEPGAPAADQIKGQIAAAIREGRKRQLKDDALGKAQADAAHKAALSATDAAFKKAVSVSERSAHAHGFWKGGAVVGSMIAAAAVALLAWYTNSILGPTFEAASQARMQDTVVQQLDRQVNPPEPVYPGEQP